MIVVVGGSSSKAGKTTVVCEIIAATRQAQWTAIKITPHEHKRKQYGDTERYLDAGAARAILASGLPLVEGNTIIESNSVLEDLTPDLFVFVDGGSEWKPSALRYIGKADFRVTGHATAELIDFVRERVSTDLRA